MKVLVIGGHGFLGRRLIESLIKMNVETTSIVRSISSAQVKRCHFILVDEIINMRSNELPKYDVIVNVAMKRSSRALPIPNETIQQLNFVIPLEIIRRTALESTLLVNTSTYIQNFQGVRGNTVESYGYSKQLLTEGIEQDALKGYYNVVDLFLFTLYGPNDRPTHLIPLILSALKRDSALELTGGDQMINLLYLEDAVGSILNAVNNFYPGYNPYHLWHPKYLTVKELVVAMEELAGKKLQAKWGSISYSGHEMFEPWPVPFQLFPRMLSGTSLLEGLRKVML
jgi:nucleoside-diphosphate-sugar epimerase